MVNVHTQFGKLKTVIVGREMEIPLRTVDTTFKYFYKEALGQGLYNSCISEYRISEEILAQRIEQVDNLAKLLESLGVKVFRPERVTSMKKIQTTTFSSEASSASNVRDLTWIYRNTIVETPPFIRNRYFENVNLYTIYENLVSFDSGERWVKAPLTKLTNETIDLEDWRAERDMENVPDRFEMAIDGAQFLPIGSDVIVNVATYNHKKGLDWVKSLFPDTNFHVVKCADNHIDGELVSICPGKFLLNPNFSSVVPQLPEKFQKWEFLVPDDDVKDMDTTGMTDIDIRLASSRGMDINVLNLDEHTILVNKRATGVRRLLERKGFDVIDVELDYGELFAGGIHCTTLDVNREDEHVGYC